MNTFLKGFDEKAIQSSNLYSNAQLIKSVFCKYRIEEIDYPFTRQVRCFLFVVDEWRAMEKILQLA